MRRKRLIRNTTSSVIFQITTIVCAFILPRLILKQYGSEVNGLIHSVTQFLQIIGFLELGVGAVVQSALYKPLADNDNKAISEIIASANRFFQRIAHLLLFYVVILMVTFPYIASQRFGHLFTAILIAAMSINSFAQYYFGVVDRLLLTADQRGYIQYYSQTISLILNTIASVILIRSGASIHLVKLTTSLIFLLRPIALRVYVNHHYAISRKIEIFDEPIKQKWNGIAQHIAAVVLEQTDIVVLTIFRTLTDVSIYSIYYLVASGVKHLFMSMTNGLQAILGELWAKQELPKLKNVFGWIEWTIHNGVVLIFGCTAVLIIPFISVYTRGISDANYIHPLFASLLVLAHASHCLRLPHSMMILAGGHYKQTQANYFIAAGINVLVSVATVKRWGLNGVAMGTLVAMAYHSIWMSIYNSKNLLKWPLRNFLKQIVSDGLIVLVGLLCTSLLRHPSLNYLSWLIFAIKVFLIWFTAAVIVNLFLYKHKMAALFLLVKKIPKSIRAKLLRN